MIDRARMLAKPPILFIDEIHRFSKSQQDSLLGAVEKGLVTLIGATTENPSFEVIAPLLSRSQIYVLKPLEKKHLIALLENAVETLQKRYNREIILKEDSALMQISGGDARKLLNAIELVVDVLDSEISDKSKALIITDQDAKRCIQNNLVKYDKKKARCTMM